MNFVRVGQIADGIEPLRTRLMKDLADGRRVLWLVSGGSNIPLSVAVMAELPDELTKGLTVMLTDERYGDVGHADSNAQKLDATGFLPKQATVLPVLREGLSMEETSQRYAADFQEAARTNDIILAQFGMGADGHIAGILPGSPALESADLACGYEWTDFKRISLTPKALMQVTSGWLFAFGTDKSGQLTMLQNEIKPIAEQPAQLLKQLPEAYVFNDQTGQKQGEPS